MSKLKFLFIFILIPFVLWLDYFVLKYYKSTDGLWHGHFNLVTNVNLNADLEKCLALPINSSVLSNIKLIKLTTPFSFSEIELHQRVDMCFKRYQLKTHIVEIKNQYYTRRNILLGNENHFVYSNKLYFKKNPEPRSLIEIFKQSYGLDYLKIYDLTNQKNYLLQVINSNSASDILYLCNYLTKESDFDLKCLTYKDLSELKLNTKQLIDYNSAIN